MLLDIPAADGLARARAAGRRRDKLRRESLEFHERVRQAFRTLAEADPRRYLVVDAAAAGRRVGRAIRVAYRRSAPRLASRAGRRADAAASADARSSGPTAARVRPT